ncbi:MAG: Zinc dependent phospholipase C [Methanocella sp. PtaU1.Bin125]|nr:MAG: Zinc dependent phospholipase C [Methanocella sp. PtaU1.Bin125]
MENRQYLIPVAVLVIAVLVIPQNALAYNNVDAHQAVNAHAIEYFEKYIMPKDQYLKSASLSGSPCVGIAWDIEDGADTGKKTGPARTVSINKRKALQEWIIDAGYSADEPEAPMALRHFYDPERQPRYLTDQIVDWNVMSYGNPQMDAYTWAFTAPDNPYTFQMAKTYYRRALESVDPENEDYGNAWRAVGETMHMFADMTVPAHVRNDGHVRYDLYERFTRGDSVDDYAYRAAVKSLDYDCAYASDSQSLQKLFTDLAAFTHNNFFSEDTLPLWSSTTTTNGNALYASPVLNIDPSFTGYYKRTVDGRETLMATQKLSSRLGLWTTPVLGMDWKVLDSQQQVLIPTAIRADAAVLDAFLPRYAVTIDSVTPVLTQPGVYTVEGHITHVPTREWPSSPEIRNGAHVVVNGKDYAITPYGNAQSLKTIRVDVPAADGDVLYMYYDLGGYVIKSGSVRIKGPAPTPSPTPKATPKPTQAPTKKPTSPSSGTAFKSNDILYLEITPAVAEYIVSNELKISYNGYYLVMISPGHAFVSDDKYLISRVTSYTNPISDPPFLEVTGRYWSSYGSDDNQFWDKDFVESHFQKVGTLDLNKANFGFSGDG